MKKKTLLIKLIIAVLSGYLFVDKTFAQGKESIQINHIKTIPYTLKVFNSPIDVEITNDSIVTITAGEKTNLFNSPGNNYYKQDAAMLLFRPDSNFIFKAKVKADLKEVYDVAALLLYHDKDLWAKLCFENSIEKRATVVSVVTRKFSDDCNSVEVSNNFVYLLIAKKGNEFAFHYSTDNLNWHLVRHFRLDSLGDNLLIGFAVHCSKGNKFSAEFSEINYSDVELKNMRIFKYDQ